MSPLKIAPTPKSSEQGPKPVTAVATTLADANIDKNLKIKPKELKLQSGDPASVHDNSVSSSGQKKSEIKKINNKQNTTLENKVKTPKQNNQSVVNSANSKKFEKPDSVTSASDAKSALNNSNTELSKPNPVASNKNTPLSLLIPYNSEKELLAIRRGENANLKKASKKLASEKSTDVPKKVKKAKTSIEKPKVVSSKNGDPKPTPTKPSTPSNVLPKDAIKNPAKRQDFIVIDDDLTENVSIFKSIPITPIQPVPQKISMPSPSQNNSKKHSTPKITPPSKSNLKSPFNASLSSKSVLENLKHMEAQIPQPNAQNKPSSSQKPPGKPKISLDFDKNIKDD